MPFDPQFIDSQYRVIRRLGGGGFSDVYLVQGPAGECALKLLRPKNGPLAEGMVEPFKIEFRILKDLNHPNIARILDFGCDPPTGRYYFTSEWIKGDSLFDATAALDPQAITALVVETLRALHYLHTSRIYHFDIKADNVLVVGSTPGQIKLIDFGLAGIDPRGRLIGTPSSMAPEIVSHEPADHRADLYSLGILWYLCLTRHNPFRGATTEASLARQLQLIPPPPSTSNAQVPDWCDRIVMRLLEKNPANRFGSAIRVIREIIQSSGERFPMETQETLLSYLPEEGRLIGRSHLLGPLLEAIHALKTPPAAGAPMPSALSTATPGWLIMGAIGTGKSRLLTEVKYAAQLQEVRVVSTRGVPGPGLTDWCAQLDRHAREGDGIAMFLVDGAEAIGRDEMALQHVARLAAMAGRLQPPRGCLVVLAVRDAIAPEALSVLQAALPRHLILENFSPEELRAYLTTVTGLPDPPAELLTGLFRRTQGNPLFVTEVLRGLILGGGLFDEHGRWQATFFEDVGVDFSKVVVPRTLEELLLGRVGLLAPEPRRLLEALAVIDRPATGAELGHWAEVPDPFPAVNELLRGDFCIRETGATYDFKNGLMGHAIYTRLAPTERARYHDRIAAGADPRETPAAIRLHHMSRGSDRTEAIAAAGELGDYYLKQGLGKRAVAYLQQAVELIPAAERNQRIETCMKLGEAYLIGREYGAAEAQFGIVEQLLAEIAPSAQVSHWRVETLVRLGGIFIKLQALERAKAAFAAAEAILQTSPPDRVRALQIANFQATVALQEGRAEEARATFAATRDAQKALSYAEQGLVTNNDLGLALLALHDVPKAEAVFHEDLDIATTLRDDLLIARAHYNLAETMMATNRYPEATEAYQQCIAVCKRSENTELLLRAYNELGNLRLLVDDLEGSCRYYERALALHERTGDLRGGAAIHVNLGIAEHARHRTAAALDHLLPAVNYLHHLAEKSATDWLALVRGLLECAEIFRSQRDFTAGRARVTEALDHIREVPGLTAYRFWALLGLAQIARDTQQSAEFDRLCAELTPLATSDEMRQQLAALDQSVAEPSPKALVAARAAPLTNSERVWSISGAGGMKDQFFRHILEINKLLNAQRDLPFVLATVLHYALELTRAESGAVILVDPHGALQVACQHNLGEREEELKLSRTLAGQVLAGGEWVLTNDAQHDARFAAETSIVAYQLKSILCLPIRAKRTIVGVLYLDHRFRPGAFAGVEMPLLEAFTDQAGLAIENAQLIEALRQRESVLDSEVKAATERLHRYEEILQERAPFAPRLDYGPMVAESRAMQEIVRLCDKVADTDLGVLLLGESGTGKELIARALHRNHQRRQSGRFVAINCGAIPATLIESELFGYKTGAFTGAVHDKRGLVEEAEGGTLFLDEVTELDASLQAKLLRVLQEREFTRIGDTRPTACDIRVIAASNRDVEGLVSEGKVREDLYYRICQLKITLPPLRERREDIPPLVAACLAEAAPTRHLQLRPSLLRRLLDYPWPGNVRELRNIIQVAAALCEGPDLDERAIPTYHPLAHEGAVGPPADTALRSPALAPIAPHAAVSLIAEELAYDPNLAWHDYERLIVAKAFAVNDFQPKPTAAELGIGVTTLYKRIREWSLLDQTNPVYQVPFPYQRGRTLAAYLPLIFRAAYRYANHRPYIAIANLKISQGYFYKVMRRVPREPAEYLRKK